MNWFRLDVPHVAFPPAAVSSAVPWHKYRKVKSLKRRKLTNKKGK